MRGKIFPYHSCRSLMSICSCRLLISFAHIVHSCRSVTPMITRRLRPEIAREAKHLIRCCCVEPRRSAAEYIPGLVRWARVSFQCQSSEMTVSSGLWKNPQTARNVLSWYPSTVDPSKFLIL